MTRLKYKGVWWLPKNKKNHVSGVLIIDSDKRAYLELMGQLDIYDGPEVDIILGITSDGKEITLYNCFELSKEINSSEIFTTVVSAGIMFEGAHFNSKVDIKFHEISCNYFNLDEWAWMDEINISMLLNDALQIKYDLPEKVSTVVNKEYTIEISPNIQTLSYRLGNKKTSIIKKMYVKIINKKLNSFEKHSDKIFYIQNFISLGVGEPVKILDVIGKTEVNKLKSNGLFIYPKVKIYFCDKQSTKDHKPISPSYMLYNLRDIKEEFSIILKKLFNKEESLNPQFNLYFDTIYNCEMSIEQKFLSLLTQVIESYNARKKKVKVECNNEFMLVEKLNEVIEGCCLFVNLSTLKKRKIFISKLCDTRNYYTYYDTGLAYTAAKGMELLEICDKLKVIIEFNLLLEIGFKNRKAHELIDKYIQYNILG